MRTRLDLLVELRFLPASGDRGAPPVIFMIEGHTDPGSLSGTHGPSQSAENGASRERRAQSLKSKNGNTLRFTVSWSTVSSFWTLSEARSRLYQRRSLRPRRHFSAFIDLHIFLKLVCTIPDICDFLKPLQPKTKKRSTA